MTPQQYSCQLNCTIDTVLELVIWRKVIFTEFRIICETVLSLYCSYKIKMYVVVGIIPSATRTSEYQRKTTPPWDGESLENCYYSNELPIT